MLRGTLCKVCDCLTTNLYAGNPYKTKWKEKHTQLSQIISCRCSTRPLHLPTQSKNPSWTMAPGLHILWPLCAHSCSSFCPAPSSLAGLSLQWLFSTWSALFFQTATWLTLLPSNHWLFPFQLDSFKIARPFFFSFFRKTYHFTTLIEHNRLIYCVSCALSVSPARVHTPGGPGVACVPHWCISRAWYVVSVQ